MEIDANLGLHTYLARIHYSAENPTALQPTLPLLKALHEVHMLAVPFENLSIHFQQPIHLEDAALFEKIVRRNRGGFCSELNGLFTWLLRQIGYEVTLLSAEVAGADGTYSPAFDHLTLHVHHLDGIDWLADVGFGDSFRLPLQLAADVEQDGGDGHRYRLRSSNTLPEVSGDTQVTWWTLERDDGNRWEPQYRFTLQPHAMAEFAPRCQYQQTSPQSHFTQKRICSLALPDGRITLSNLRLITTRSGCREERELASEDEYRDVLASRFGVVV